MDLSAVDFSVFFICALWFYLNSVASVDLKVSGAALLSSVCLRLPHPRRCSQWKAAPTLVWEAHTYVVEGKRSEGYPPHILSPPPRTLHSVFVLVCSISEWEQASLGVSLVVYYSTRRGIGLCA